MPFGPPNLCAEIATRSTAAAARATSSQGTAWTASVWTNADGARARTRAATSSSGWIVPTSLFTSMRDTSAVRSSTASSRASTSTTPFGVTATNVSTEAVSSEAIGGGEHALVLERRGHHQVATAGSPRGTRRPLHCEVVGLGPTRGEDDLGGAGAEQLRHLLPGRLECGLGRPGGRVTPAGIPERPVEKGLHRRHGFGPHRRGRGVIKVCAGGIHASSVRSDERPGAGYPAPSECDQIQERRTSGRVTPRVILLV